MVSLLLGGTFHLDMTLTRFLPQNLVILSPSVDVAMGHSLDLYRLVTRQSKPCILDPSILEVRAKQVRLPITLRSYLFLKITQKACVVWPWFEKDTVVFGVTSDTNDDFSDSVHGQTLKQR